jgi:hypothetical protein
MSIASYRMVICSHSERLFDRSWAPIIHTVLRLLKGRNEATCFIQCFLLVESQGRVLDVQELYERPSSFTVTSWCLTGGQAGGDGQLDGPTDPEPAELRTHQ